MPRDKARCLIRGSYKRSSKGSQLPCYTEKNSLFEVKEKHKYWFQSQMQMGITVLPLTDFVVFTNSRYPIQIEWWNNAKFTCFSWKVYIKNKNTEHTWVQLERTAQDRGDWRVVIGGLCSRRNKGPENKTHGSFSVLFAKRCEGTVQTSEDWRRSINIQEICIAWSFLWNRRLVRAWYVL